MKRWVKGFLISLSMFSTIPLPKMWEKSALHWVIPTLPLVGLIVGGLWYGVTRVLMSFEISLMLQAAGVFLTPLLLTGGIHLDGYMDVVDATSSRAELKKKQAILMDPHIGAFAAMALGVYLLVGFAVVYSLLEVGVDLLAFVLIPVWSRCLAGVVLLVTKPMKKTGFVATFHEKGASHHVGFLLFLLLLSIGGAYLISGLDWVAPLFAVVVSGTVATLYGIRQLGGISGDVCGFVIIVSELCGLLVLVTI